MTKALKFIGRAFGLFAAVVVIALIIDISNDSETPKVNNTSPEVIENVEDILEVDAIVLRESYENNEIKADTVYKDKKAKISGIINSIGKDILDDPYVTIGQEEYGITSVQCMLAKGEDIKAAEMNKGDSVILLGTIDGASIVGGVLVRNCYVQ